MQFKLFCLAIAVAAASRSQTVATTPVGGVVIDIAAGTGSTRTLTAVSVPVLMGATASGQMTGQITGVTTTTLTNSAAGWTAGQLSATAAPYVVRMKSGAAAGRTFLISTTTANTATTVTIDAGESPNLTGLSIAAGDTYELIAVDTLAILFPSGSGVLGGSSATAADNILINKAGVWRTYFYSTTLNRWTQVALGNPDASNEPIKPDTALLYGRLAASTLTVKAFGSAPAMGRKAPVINSGVTFLANGWPADVTLLASGIQAIPGWVANAASASADKVQLLSGGVYKTYYFDGTNWRQVALGNPIKNSDLIGATAGVLVNKLGSASGTAVLTQALPYSL